jgi:hypothetical protein
MTPTTTHPPDGQVDGTQLGAAPADARSGGGLSAEPLGRVGAPQGAEATSEEFCIWVPDTQLVEKTQLIRVDGTAGPTPVCFYGLVTEVLRRSRRASILEEADRYDSQPTEQVPLDPGGVTFATVRVLAAEPHLLAPPQEEALAYPADPADAAVAYRVAEMGWPTPVGLIRNGGLATAGPAMVDLDYLLGAQGGHLNVTGIAGVGTKSSFLTVVLAQVLDRFRRHATARPADPAKPQARAVILNVKGFDLFWLDHWSSAFGEQDLAMWAQMGLDHPRPLAVDFYAPQMPGSATEAIPVGRAGVRPYSWSLEDVLAQDLLGYLFADSDRDDDNFALLLGDVERLLVDEGRTPDGQPTRALAEGAPARSFADLLAWFQDGLRGDGTDTWYQLEGGGHHPGTLRRFYRRLRRIVTDGGGILRPDRGDAHPLDVTGLDGGRPAVVDIYSLPDPHLQRFVVAALLKQAAEDQTGPAAIPGMHYLFVLDELNRFAPKGQSDPITKLIETVAAELRSRGVILLGAQQQASMVSPRVVDNAAVRALGRTTGSELGQDAMSFLPRSLRGFVQTMDGGDKLLWAPTLREPLLARVPRPPWAMRRAEAATDPPAFLDPAHAPAVAAGPGRLSARPYGEL